MSLNVGDRVPEFKAVASNGHNVTLADYRGQNSVVVYFSNHGS